MQIKLEIHDASHVALGVYMAVAIGEGAVQGVFQGDGTEIDAWVASEGYEVVEVIDIVS